MSIMGLSAATALGPKKWKAMMSEIGQGIKDLNAPRLQSTLTDHTAFPGIDRTV
jgi:hypothetical protein